MYKKLLDRIKFLENEIKNREELITTLKKNCKIPENKKLEVIKVLKKQNKISECYFKDDILSFDIFVELVQEIRKGYLLIVDFNNKNEVKIKAVLNFFIKRFSSIFSTDGDFIYGIVFFDELNKLKKLRKIHYFNREKEDFEDIELYKVVFEAEKFDRFNLEKAKKKFIEIRKKPSLKFLHYLEYSLTKNKFIDLEKELIESEKERYRYVYDVTYPNLEIKLKYEIDNLPFLYTLIERIDNESNQIKSSRGTLIVVKRMLDYIIEKCPYNNIIGLAQLLKARLEDDYNNLNGKKIINK
jgi:hypothetical protein